MIQEAHQGFWKDAERVDLLKALWADGKTCSQIAKEFAERYNTFLSRNAVIGKAHRLGLTARVIVVGAKRGRKPKPKEASRPAPIEFRTAPAKRPISASVPPTPPEPGRAQRIEGDLTPRHLSLLDLHAGECRWPYGEGPFTFCGCAAPLGAPYCTAHQKLSRSDEQPRSRPYASDPYTVTPEVAAKRTAQGSFGAASMGEAS